MMAFARSGAMVLALSLAIVQPAEMANAQSAKPQARPSKARLESAAANLRIILSALQSDTVPQPVKDALFGCIYQNSLSKITDGVEKVLAANPGKVDRKNPTQMLGLIAGTCGYRPANAPAKAR
jgi:hypothetical protein